MKTLMSRLERIAKEAIDGLLGNNYLNEKSSYTTEIMNIHCTPPPDNVIAAISESNTNEGFETASSVICISHIDMNFDYIKFGLFRELIQELTKRESITHICLKIDYNENYARRFKASPLLTVVKGYKRFGFQMKIPGYEVYSLSKC